MTIDQTSFGFIHAFVLLKVLLTTAVLMSADAPLTSVQAVRTLTPEQAARQLPVKLNGIVTYFDGSEGHAFIQDSSGGIFFHPGRSGQSEIPKLKAGERIEIEGVTKQGRFSPSVGATTLPAESGSVASIAAPVKILHLSAASFPTPSEVTLDQVMTGACHDQFVRMRGVIRSIDIEPRGPGRRTSALTLNVSFARGNIWVRIPDFDSANEAEVRSWKDIESVLDGVIAGGANALGQITIWDLTPGVIQKYGLHVALKKLAQEMHAKPECKIDVHVNGDDRALPDRIATHLFRVAQEALSNALKYSQANDIDVALSVASDEVILTIQDNGIGFDDKKAPGPDQGHFGLRGMRERMKRIGGTLTVQSNANGTIITAKLVVNSF